VVGIAVKLAATVDLMVFIAAEKFHCHPVVMAHLGYYCWYYYNLHPCYFPFHHHRWG